MFEENSVTPANSCFSTACWIPGEADTRGWIEQMAFHATIRHAFGDATLNDPVESISNNETGCWIDTTIASYKMCGVEVEFVVITVSISTKHTYPQPEIYREVASDAPVILKVRLKNLIAVVELGLGTGLSER